MCIKPENELTLLQQCIDSNQVSASRLVQHAAEGADIEGLNRLALDEKIVKKRAFAIYKKHITGRGYAWPVGCTMPDDAQAAVAEGMREGYALGVAQFDSVRQQLEEKQTFIFNKSVECGRLQSELTELRSSIDAGIERTIELTIDAYEERAGLTATPLVGNDHFAVRTAVLAQVNGEKNG